MWMLAWLLYEAAGRSGLAGHALPFALSFELALALGG